MRAADRVVERVEGAAFVHEAPRGAERARLFVRRVLRVLVERERVVRGEAECAVARTNALESKDENAFVQTIAEKGMLVWLWCREEGE